MLTTFTDASAGREKSSAWTSKTKNGHSKKRKWAVLTVLFLIIAGAVVGGVVGALEAGKRNGSGNGSACLARRNAQSKIHPKAPPCPSVEQLVR